MEALVVAIAALVALVLIDAGHWIAVSLIRWAPIVIVGAATGWLAGRQGVTPLEALGIGVFACVLARWVTYRLRRASPDDGDFY